MSANIDEGTCSKCGELAPIYELENYEGICEDCARNPDKFDKLPYEFPDYMLAIECDPHVCCGKPAIYGTRIRVKDVAEMLVNGWSDKEIIRSYPRLTRQHIDDCRTYIIRQLEQTITEE